MFSSDDDHLQNFDEVPYGLVRQMVRKGAMDAAGQRQVAMEAWEQVERRMAGDLPDPTKYVDGACTWLRRRACGGGVAVAVSVRHRDALRVVYRVVYRIASHACWAGLTLRRGNRPRFVAVSSMVTVGCGCGWMAVAV